MNRRFAMLLMCVLSVLTSGCRVNNAKLTSSMSDTERNSIVCERFFVGMTKGEVGDQLVDLRLVEPWRRDTEVYIPVISGERYRVVFLRPGVLPAGNDMPPGGPLKFYMNQADTLTRVTCEAPPRQGETFGSQPEREIPLDAAVERKEPAP